MSTRAYVCFPDGRNKALTISCDDGLLADRRPVAIFNRYGIKGTFVMQNADKNETAAAEACPRPTNYLSIVRL